MQVIRWPIIEEPEPVCNCDADMPYEWFRDNPCPVHDYED
jgi:hypothetical protein